MFRPGTYEVINSDGVRIRREPRIVEGWKNNRVGLLTKGTQRRILDFVTGSDNVTWGRVSEPDGAGISQWVCIQDVNRTFMKLVVDQGELLDRLDSLIAWARTQGYKG